MVSHYRGFTVILMELCSCSVLSEVPQHASQNAWTCSSLVGIPILISYFTVLPSQAPSIVESNRPPSDWPQEGKVTFKDYSTRYRDGLDLVLKSIACVIPGGQKVYLYNEMQRCAHTHAC